MANPFLETTFEIPWSRLTPERIVPGITEALGRAQSAVDAVASRDPGSLTFENTFLALESSTEELDRAWSRVNHLQSVADSPALRTAHHEMLPKVSAFFAAIPLNAELWRRLKTFAESPAAKSVTGIRRRYLEETVADFREAGADLPPDKRKRLEALQTELAQATQKYSDNVLDSTNAWELIVDEEARLAGLPEHAKARARQAAASAGRPTGWRFTLHLPSMDPFMTYIEDGELRRQMWEASISLGAKTPFDNAPLISRILSLRAEKARLLGKPHFADVLLERRMAKTGQRALDFLEDVQRRCAGAFARDCRELEQFKASQTGHPPRPLAPWEVAFWAEKMRLANYAFNEEALRPYFPMDRVLAGLFELVHRIFGLSVTQKQAEGWHPEVKFYEIRDEAGRHLGSFYTDWHPRESKRGGAWMGSLSTGGPRPGGVRVPHMGINCGNMTPPSAGNPALLTHREVETIFHEFGHLLHHVLSEVEIRALSGTSVAWDFVELPSQIMENWCWERESLDLFARHYQTGAPIPEDLFRKMIAAKNFRSACAVMRQISLGKMDLLMHLHAPEFATEKDVEPKARAAVAECLIPTEPPAPTVVKRFNHIFSHPDGYAAGYYSYKWAEVLDADAFTRFKREGIFNRKTGADFVDKILSRGNSADAGSLFRAFMGRDPDITAFLVRVGLAA